VGVAQARLAIQVVRAFIEGNLKPAENRKRLLQPVERVASLAQDEALIDVFERFALDPLEVVPGDRIAIEEFQVPQIIATAHQSIAHRA